MGFKIQRAIKSRVPEARPKQREPANKPNHRVANSRDGLALEDLLRRMVGRMTPNFALREDLHQEALIHLWRMETRRPGQTKSWYAQSCKFHLSHYLASGCSVDSVKRGRGHSRYDEDCVQPEGFPELVESGNSVVSQVSAWDLISVLSPHLCPRELAVLDSLADGLGGREIGRKLNLSFKTVDAHRGHIKEKLALRNHTELISFAARWAAMQTAART